MNSVIECAHCGFSNWPGEVICSRCASPLSFIEEVTREAGVGRGPAARATNRCSFCGTEFEGHFCTLCRKPLRPHVEPLPSETEPSAFSSLFMPTKTKLIVAAVVVAVTAAAALFARGVGHGGATRSHGEAIRKSFDFQTPVAVSFADRGEQLAPGVEVLRELGVVNYRFGTLTLRRLRVDLAVWIEDYTLAERGEIVPGAKPVPLVAVTLTETGKKDSAGWGTFKPPAEAQSPWKESQGWRVPVGVREFVEVRDAQPVSQGAVDLLEVVFAWRWRPNELGRHFDVSSEEFKALSAGAQLSALSRDFNDSTMTYQGRALLKYEAGQWVVRDLSFGDDPRK